MKRFDLTRLLLALCGLFCALIVVYVLSEFQHLTTRIYIAVGLIGAIGVVSIVAMRMGPDARISTIIVVASIFASFFIADLYFAHFGTDSLTRLRIREAEAAGGQFDRRSMDQVIRSMRRDPSNKAVPSVGTHATLALGYGDGIPSGSTKLLPLGGVSNRTTVLCNETGEWISYFSDERGFNNPSGIWGADVEIAIIGDSFAHGSCVPETDHWVSKIRARFPQTLNLAIGGNDLLSNFATLQEFLPDLKPRIVLWAFYEGNDLQVAQELASPILNRYVDDADFRQNLVLYQDSIDTDLDRIVDQRLAAQKFDVVGFLKLYNLRQQFGIEDIPPPVVENHQNDAEKIALLKTVLTRAQNIVGQWNGDLFLIYLPQSARFVAPDAEFIPGEQLSPYYEDVVQTTSELGIPLIDLVPVFQAAVDPMSYFPFGLHGHYNQTGYAVVASEVLDSLEERDRETPDQ